MSDLISVIVPIYNISSYLEKCITSIQNQTYRHLQILLVDDGSTDCSDEICDSYQKQDHRIEVIHKENGGLVSARKAGLLAALGKYICYVDGDDWIESDLIEHLYTGIEKEQVDLVCSNHFCDLGEHIWKVEGRYKEGIYDAKDLIPTILYTGEFYEFGISQFVWAKLFRRELLWDAQMQVDERISCGEDVAVTYPYLLRARKVCMLEAAGYHYRQRMDSMTGCYQEEQEKNKILLRYLQQVFRDSVYSEDLLVQLNQYAKNLLLARQISCFDVPGADMVLRPYGGIPRDAHVVLYGAGKSGQSMYHYLKRQTQVKIVDWVDKNDVRYRQMGLEVHSPEVLKSRDTFTYDFVMIAIHSRRAAGMIKKYLMEMGIGKEKIRWLEEGFVREDYLVLGSW